MGKARNGLTAKMKALADDYLETKNGTESYIKVYKTKSRKSASVEASRTLAKPSVRSYLEGIANKSARNIEVLSDTARSENVRLQANQDILDRAGYKAREALDITSVSFSLSLLFDKTKGEAKE